MDFKLADEQQHLKYTGASNKIIKDNIRRMDAEFTGDIHVRIPTIPTINMTEENMRLTAEFVRPLKQVRDIELLPYHKLGVDTYRKMGKKYELERYPVTKSGADEQHSIKATGISARMCN